MSFTNVAKRRETSGDMVSERWVPKAYVSLSFRANTLECDNTINVWTRIKTNAIPVIGTTSGNCTIIDNGDNTYNYRYIDTEHNLARTFLMNAHIYVDFTAGGSMKTTEWRMVLSRAGLATPLETFCVVESDKDGEAVSSSVIFSLLPLDEVYFECRNTTDSNDITVKFLMITVVEV